MPAHAKYTREQRKMVVELFSKGRDAPYGNKRPRGDYTLKDIERMTGVKAGAAHMIAKGKR